VTESPSLLDAAVRRRLTHRHEAVNDELRRLIDAGVTLMRREPGTAPRVADIVAAAGSSNDAFYRAFGSRDGFLAVIIDDGARRLVSYLTHQRDGGSDPRARIGRCLEGLLRQAGDPEVAEATRAVLSCTPSRRSTEATGVASLADGVAKLLMPDLAALGSPTPSRDAATLARAAVGEMEAHLWAQTAPGPADRAYLEHLVDRLCRPAE
jgi:AcrR family transcriptional regulator